MEVEVDVGGWRVAWLGWMLAVHQCCPCKIEWEEGWGAWGTACGFGAVGLVPALARYPGVGTRIWLRLGAEPTSGLVSSSRCRGEDEKGCLGKRGGAHTLQAD